MHCYESELWLELCTRGALVLLVSIYGGHSMIPVLIFLVENCLAAGYSGRIFGENLKDLGQFQSKIGSWPHCIVSFQPRQILSPHRHLSMQLESVLVPSFHDGEQVTTQIAKV
jgi:hypothetical protein